jgi:hypothetical protein
VPETLSAILSKPPALRLRGALYIGLTAEVAASAPSRYGLAGIDVVAIGRGDVRAATRSEADGTTTLAIQLADPRLSTRHARLTRLGGRWVVEDLGSKNGTWIRGDAIQQHTLEDADVFELGHTMLVFRVAGGEAGDLDAPPEAPPGLATLSPVLADTLESVVRAARAAVPIMIGGETGTGKELVARAVHALSGRAGPFVAINCGAVAANLVEAELFGHV